MTVFGIFTVLELVGGTDTARRRLTVFTNPEIRKSELAACQTLASKAGKAEIYRGVGAIWGLLAATRTRVRKETHQ